MSSVASHPLGASTASDHDVDRWTIVRLHPHLDMPVNDDEHERGARLIHGRDLSAGESPLQSIRLEFGFAQYLELLYTMFF